MTFHNNEDIFKKLHIINIKINEGLGNIGNELYIHVVEG